MLNNFSTLFPLLLFGGDSNSIIILKHAVFIALMCGYLSNYKKASPSDTITMIWLIILSFIENHYGIGYLENYKVFYIALCMQCHIYYFRKNRFLAFSAMKIPENDSPNSLKHWAIIVVPYDIDNRQLDLEANHELDIYHAVGKLSHLVFHQTKITVAVLNENYRNIEFATVIDRSELLTFKKFEAKTPFTLGIGTCQDFCLYFAQALSSNIMRCYLRMFSSERMMTRLYLTLFLFLQFILLSEGILVIIPVDLIIAVMISADFINCTKLYQNTPVFNSTSTYSATFQMILIITPISIIVNYFHSVWFVNMSFLTIVAYISSIALKHRDKAMNWSDLTLSLQL